MKVVSNASPLITLARLGHLDLLRKLYDAVYISTEVYNEVVIAGAGMPGAAAVAKADWIHVTPVGNTEDLAKTMVKIGLGAGEVSAVFLAKELRADITLMDEWKGRRFAVEEGLTVVGCIGLLEELHRRGEIKDLRGNYQELLRQGAIPGRSADAAKQLEAFRPRILVVPEFGIVPSEAKDTVCADGVGCVALRSSSASPCARGKSAPRSAQAKLRGWCLIPFQKSSPEDFFCS